jgi:cobalt/nickel transport system permease protein
LFVYFQNEKEAFELLIKTNLILLFNIALFFSSKGYDIVRGLDALGFSKKIVSIFYFTLSLINYLNNDIRIKRKALSSRGFKSTTSMFTYETYGNIFAMIIIKALRKSDEMKLSMKARGFAGEIYFLNKRRANLLEWTLFLSTLIVLIKVVYELYA